jgi:hypothetical protein
MFSFGSILPFCGGALISAHVCLPKHVASKFSACSHVQIAVQIDGAVSGAKPVSGFQSGISDPEVSRQRRRKNMYAISLWKLIPFHRCLGHLFGLQRNMQSATLQPATSKPAPSNMHEVQHTP